MSFDLTELRDVFFDEAYEHLGTLETALLALEQQPGNRELLNQIFRAAHSIKGGSGTFGFTDLLRFTHALEGLLHLVRDGVIAFAPPLPGSPSPDTTDALLAEIERAMPRTYEPAPLTRPSTRSPAYPRISRQALRLRGRFGCSSCPRPRTCRGSGSRAWSNSAPHA